MKKKILIIEDDMVVRENTAEILQLANYEVIAAENGKSGLEKAFFFKPDRKSFSGRVVSYCFRERERDFPVSSNFFICGQTCSAGPDAFDSARSASMSM